MVAPQVSKVKGSTRGSFLRALKLLCLRQVLYSEDGYTYLDVRPELEVQEVGKVKGSVNISIMNATRKYDPEQKKKVTQKSPNEAFADMVKKRFPDPETKLLVACSDGRKYSMDALTALDEAGYVNICRAQGAGMCKAARNASSRTEPECVDAAWRLHSASWPSMSAGAVR